MLQGCLGYMDLASMTLKQIQGSKREKNKHVLRDGDSHGDCKNTCSTQAAQLALEIVPLTSFT